LAVVGGLLGFIGLAGIVIAVWALAKGALPWANIPSRKAAAGVLAAAFVVTGIGGSLSPSKDSDVAVQAGKAGSTSTTASPQTTATSEATTATTEATTTTVNMGVVPIAPAPAATTSTTARVTTTTRPASTTTTTRATTTTTRPPTTGTTAKLVPTTTTTKPVTSGNGLVFGAMQCDAPGSDSAANVAEEWVEVVNNGPAVSLNGWTLHDEGPNFTYSFPAGFTIPAGGRVKVHSGSGVDTASDLYWARSQHVWNNTGDTAYLVNGSGAVVASEIC
jgi:hypothetical protein